MDWNRQDLIALVGDLNQQLIGIIIGEQPLESVEKILRHIWFVENWYLDRMDMGMPRERIIGGVFEMLALVRQNAAMQLPRLIGVPRVNQPSGELWSGRKVVRRLLWHEKDHYGQLERLLLKSQTP